VLTVAALLNRRAALPASVLAADWLVSVLLETQGSYSVIPFVDAAAFYGILLSIWDRTTWERLTALGCVLMMLVAHVGFWIAYSQGVYYGDEYKWALYGLFALAMAALALGGLDARSIVGIVLEGCRSLLGRPAGPRVAGGSARETGEEATR